MAESIMDQIDDDSFAGGARILVVGVGGGGGNAVKNMIDMGLKGVEFICANTDLQALKSNPAPVRLQLGEKLTRGLGAGSRPEVGREAAMESVQSIQEALANADMVFVTAGMGGGTGTGAAPVVAETAKKVGALTVGVVTRPFSYEGKVRAANAQAGIDELSKHVDCLISIPNDRIMALAPKKTPMRELMAKANDVLYFGVKGISDVITKPGYVNLDFADVRTCMENAGRALMGMGTGRGENRAEDAVREAIASPLLEDISLKSSKAVLYNISAPDDISGEEVELIGTRIRESVHEDANIVFGCVFNEEGEDNDEVRVTVVATGIDADPVLQREPGNAQKNAHGKPGAAPQGMKPQGQAVAHAGAEEAVASSDASQPAFLRNSTLDYGARRAFREEARNRWRQEKGDLPMDMSKRPGADNGSDDPFGDEMEIPTFLRKNVD